MALFKSTYEALTFAFNYNGSNTVTAHIGDTPPPSGNGRGLGGLDGAAEAGNIKRIVESQTPWVFNLVVARFMQQKLPCSCGRLCCSGWAKNLEWWRAVRELSQDDSVQKTVFGWAGDVLYRFEVVARYFERGEKSSLSDIAKRARVSSRTARTHYNLIATMFHGSRLNKGLEDIALSTVDEALRKQGIVGEE